MSLENIKKAPTKAGQDLINAKWDRSPLSVFMIHPIKRRTVLYSIKVPLVGPGCKDNSTLQTSRTVPPVSNPLPDCYSISGVCSFVFVPPIFCHVSSYTEQHPMNSVGWKSMRRDVHRGGS